jgi:hypothetical protein
MPTEDQVHASLLSLLQASESNSAAAIILAENLNALLVPLEFFSPNVSGN